MRADRFTALAVLTAVAALFTARVSAHRLDEFLQAARIAVEPDRVRIEMTLTPGAAVADGIIAEIDVDRNGELSPEEQERYTGSVLDAIDVRLDDSPLRLAPEASSFPELPSLRAGTGGIVIRSEARMARLNAGPHRVFFRNRHAPESSVYLANALIPDNADVAVNGQVRDGDQRELTIELLVTQRQTPATLWLLLGTGSAAMLAVASRRLVARRRVLRERSAPEEAFAAPLDSARGCRNPRPRAPVRTALNPRR